MRQGTSRLQNVSKKASASSLSPSNSGKFKFQVVPMSSRVGRRVPLPSLSRDDPSCAVKALWSPAGGPGQHVYAVSANGRGLKHRMQPISPPPPRCWQCFPILGLLGRSPPPLEEKQQLPPVCTRQPPPSKLHLRELGISSLGGHKVLRSAKGTHLQFRERCTTARYKLTRVSYLLSEGNIRNPDQTIPCKDPPYD